MKDLLLIGVPSDTVKGKGQKLYGVIFLDESLQKFQLYLADTEDELHTQVFNDCTAGYKLSSEDLEAITVQFDEDWDNTIKFEEIGKGQWTAK